MKQARFFSISIALFLGLFGIIGFYCLPMANFSGDLTRVGMVPETMFGWRAPQPKIDPGLMQQASLKDADVVVVGDSFSDPRIWQTVLVQHGLKVRTLDWDSVRAVCTNFESWLLSNGFKGKAVVFEVVERNVVNQAKTSLECQHMAPHSTARAEEPRSPPPVTFDPDQKSYSGRMPIAIETAWTAHRYATLSHEPGFKEMMLRNGSKAIRVPDGCALFSHTECNDALFLAADSPDDIDESVIDNLAKLNARFTKITPIWAIVPNKSTAYLYSDKTFWDRAEKPANSPNLLAAFRTAIDNKVVDLYFGSNTHLSPRGYLIMGDVVYQSLPKTLR